MLREPDFPFVRLCHIRKAKNSSPGAEQEAEDCSELCSLLGVEFQLKREMLDLHPQPDIFVARIPILVFHCYAGPFQDDFPEGQEIWRRSTLPFMGVISNLNRAIVFEDRSSFRPEKPDQKEPHEHLNRRSLRPF